MIAPQRGKFSNAYRQKLPITGIVNKNRSRTRGEANGTLQYFDAVYSPQVLDHFQNPRNAGEVAAPDASVQLANPACGDILKLTLRVTGHRIQEIRFRAKGCVAAMACGSLLTELVLGKTTDEARKLRREDLVRELGGLPEASAHASHLALDTLTAALRGL
jgi:nitrogen fixation NifU-like protein